MQRIEQEFKHWQERVQDIYYGFCTWDNARKKREFMQELRDSHQGRFFYAFHNYSVLHPKSLRCRVVGFKWKKFKKLLADVEPEYFDNLIIYKG